MRSIGWTALVVLILIAAYLCVPVSRASRKEAKKPRPAAVLVEDDDRMVVGYGRTADAARDRALDKARDRVVKLLEKRFDMSDWEPRPEQLDPDYLVRFGVVQPDGDPEPGPVVGDEKGMVARYTVQLTPEYLREVQRVARLEWVENRHLLLARILAGAVALLLVTAGYLRLEEVTRGYATHLLRFAAIALLTIVAAGLYLM
jgi:hypothetical protein